MENGSDILMLSGVAAFCADCDDERIFVPVEGGPERGPDSGTDVDAFCCTTCDAAVFLLEVLDHIGTPHRSVA